MDKGVLLEGGSVRTTEADVSVQAPTLDLTRQMLMSGSTPHGVLVGKDFDPMSPTFCGKCRNPNADIVVRVMYYRDEHDGVPVQVCRDCVISRAPGDPLTFSVNVA